MSPPYESFEEAVIEVKKLPPQSNEILLQLYSLFKQATEGDISGRKPGLLDVRGRAKYSAWEKLKGMSQEDAKRKYCELVNELFKNS